MNKQKLKKSIDNFLGNGGLYIIMVFGLIGILCCVLSLILNMIMWYK